MSIHFQNVQLGYKGHRVIEDVTLTIPDGKITALLGPNGCGKSTLLKSISRIITPTHGSVNWNRQDIASLSPKYLATQIALLPQTQPIPEAILVRELVSYGRSPYTGFWGKLQRKDADIVNDVMKQVGVFELKDRYVSDLSGGQRQRVWLAMVLAQDTPYVLLDEPTTYMDINHQVELMAILQELNKQGKTVVTVLHDINQAARYCDHLVIMKAGALLYQGAPSEVITEDMLKRVFQVQAQVHLDPIANTPMCIVEDRV
ncbi:Fe(3+) dicitrate ABC transporter ATP-binding protein FecE [Marinomonas mediterranea]|jgi:ABC-type cobalamin/Fe3+-siderophores transport systems, ATPase components|uniref:Iron-chelate-transporting ATPase n=1 Tax=Marinomonas mediterranea (strain ATCC 700492 / JCM 21426 / NBRC 103028 / MMB-1) TaxID=717774 RepID=F2JX96_MARM1|nr:Fe(3+) dicitrate ABC transporter ATP-binding protein FecE [Marinomonas mediterranea]ADZ90702.1 Iron-chelate-transporting ATPase [Marinomonas mediterranea MMB-1]WCN16865.1 Fe(3+) dicitrate ABC transporter ATP-binding protein FecE [Marinomonas mediterranea MMB-1]